MNGPVSVEAFYKNKVYFCKGDFEPDLYVYNLKTKKQSKVALCSNVTGIYGSKLAISIISGDYSPNQIYIYDAEKSKKKTIKNTLGSNVIGKYLYYSGTNNFKGSNCNIYVKKMQAHFFFLHRYTVIANTNRRYMVTSQIER